MTRERRLERARELESRYAASAEILRFYADLLTCTPDVEHLRKLPRCASIDPADPFFARALRHLESEGGFVETEVTQNTCPRCGEKPVVAVLRPEGEGGKRSLVCSLCSAEWDFRRMLCPACGNEDPHKLPIFSAEQYPQVRVECCDACHLYIKCVDMTKDGLAVPEVDELASLPLDLWAQEHGYTKLQTNLFGL